MLAVPPHCGSAVFRGFKWSAASTGMSQIRAAQRLGFRTNVGTCYEYGWHRGVAVAICRTNHELSRTPYHTPCGAGLCRRDIDNADELATFTDRLRADAGLVRVSARVCSEPSARLCGADPAHLRVLLILGLRQAAACPALVKLLVVDPAAPQS